MNILESKISFDKALKIKISEKKFITDKLPGNFKWIGFILNAMPFLSQKYYI